MDFHERLTQRLVRGVVRHLNNLRIVRMAQRVALLSPSPAGQPVAFFKASTGIDDLSWNSAFQLLVSWTLRLQGVPVAYFACNAGMSRCVLGTHRDNVHIHPPCRSCVHQSRVLYSGVPSARDARGALHGSRTHWFTFERDSELEHALRQLNLDQLMTFVWPVEFTGVTERGDVTPGSPRRVDIENVHDGVPLPLGALCLPGLRWILRRHNLEDDDATRFLLREYIMSAWKVAHQFSQFLEATNPRAVVVFNGQFFPEATARWVARGRGARVITHEVGLQPASAFLTDGEATAYPIRIPEGFELTALQNARLDAYLEERFQGKFSMAGIQFWPSMRGLDDVFLSTLSRFRQLVPIFTNVIFDTSQPHANTVFTDMFVWLDMILAEIKSHPETLFVIRAHPDETRLRKQSRETVTQWVQARGVHGLENVVFIPPEDYLSSYELIQRAKFVVVYNSTIGVEASIMGKPVLCGGRARFTQYPTVFFPQTVEAQRDQLQEFLAAEDIDVPAAFQRNARRFLYYQLFRASLPFGEFLAPSVRKTQTRLKAFEPLRLLQTQSLTTIVKGILHDAEFLLPEEAG
jgi:hypothetical protein